MAEQNVDSSHQQRDRGTGMKRRGILAAAGAALAGIVANQTTQPVLAAVSVTLANDVGSSANNETLSTYLHNNGNNVFKHTDAAVIGESDNGPGLYGTVNFASTPQVPFSVGVYGDHGNPGGIGVHGLCAAANGIGVRGTASGATGIGMLGEIPVTTAANTVGVVGNNKSTGANGIGVQGVSTTGTGVVGSGPNGVNGNTTAVGGYGGFFTTTASSSTAVGGQIFGATSGSAAFVGAAGAGNYAAFFTGQVSINGSLFVSGGAKSAAVKHPRTGDYRALYCVESPESWFEDFGEGKLVGGKAEVKLDPDFAVLIHTEDYHVFLTPRDAGCKGLAVTAQRGDAFTVQELNGGVSTGTFSYRVVGKRSDIKLDRLAKVTMPSIKPASEPPKGPDVLASPPVPDVSPKSVPPSRPAAPAPGAQGNGGTQSNPTNPVPPMPPPRP